MPYGRKSLISINTLIFLYFRVKVPRFRTRLPKLIKGVHDHSLWTGQHLAVYDGRNVRLGFAIESGKVIRSTAEVKIALYCPRKCLHILHRHSVVFYLVTKIVKELNYNSFEIILLFRHIVVLLHCTTYILLSPPEGKDS